VLINRTKGNNVPTEPQRIKLSPGESRVVHLAGGTQVIGMAGKLLLTEAPCWIGEVMFNIQMTLCAGRVHQVSHSGCVVLQADTHAEVLCLQPGSAWVPAAAPVGHQAAGTARHRVRAAVARWMRAVRRLALLESLHSSLRL
jgi:hypothetical protein